MGATAAATAEDMAPATAEDMAVATAEDMAVATAEDMAVATAEDMSVATAEDTTTNPGTNVIKCTLYFIEENNPILIIILPGTADTTGLTVAGGSQRQRPKYY